MHTMLKRLLGESTIAGCLPRLNCYHSNKQCPLFGHLSLQSDLSSTWTALPSACKLTNCCTCKLIRLAILTQSLPAPGPFVELDGTRTPPSFFSVYVVVIPLLLGIIAPTAGLGMLVWQNDAYLGACTLGLYLVEVAAQLVSEDVYLKTSKLLSIHLLC